MKNSIFKILGLSLFLTACPRVDVADINALIEEEKAAYAQLLLNKDDVNSSLPSLEVWSRSVDTLTGKIKEIVEDKTPSERDKIANTEDAEELSEKILEMFQRDDSGSITINVQPKDFAKALLVVDQTRNNQKSLLNTVLRLFGQNDSRFSTLEPLKVSVNENPFEDFTRSSNGKLTARSLSAQNQCAVLIYEKVYGENYVASLTNNPSDASNNHCVRSVSEVCSESVNLDCVQEVLEDNYDKSCNRPKNKYGNSAFITGRANRKLPGSKPSPSSAAFWVTLLKKCSSTSETNERTGLSISTYR